MLVNESEALGYITWWGLSPAVNLSCYNPQKEEKGIHLVLLTYS